MGPLTGVRVLEFEAIGPGPFCGMLLADMGADVLLVDRAQDPRLGLGRERWYDVMMRGRRSVTLDLKTPGGVAAALALASRADALIEGFRPGVMERLGLGPDVLLARNPKLVYGRMTGWGQDGPLAARAGHDINYIALSGALHAIGRDGAAARRRRSTSSATSAAAACCWRSASPARCSRRARSGQGQVVDAAMVEGASLLDDDDLGHARGADGGTTCAARTCSTPAHRGTTRYATKDGRLRRDRRHRAQVLRGAHRAPGSCRRSASRAARSRRLARAARAASPPCSRRRRATNGAAYSKARMPALRRC